MAVSDTREGPGSQHTHPPGIPPALLRPWAGGGPRDPCLTLRARAQATPTAAEWRWGPTTAVHQAAPTQPPHPTPSAASPGSWVSQRCQLGKYRAGPPWEQAGPASSQRARAGPQAHRADVTASNLAEPQVSDRKPRPDPGMAATPLPAFHSLAQNLCQPCSLGVEASTLPSTFASCAPARPHSPVYCRPKNTTQATASTLQRRDWHFTPLAHREDKRPGRVPNPLP